MTTKTCLQCKHFYRKSANSNKGLCRRHPPTVTGTPPVLSGNKPYIGSQKTVFPTVNVNEWCGEWRDGYEDSIGARIGTFVIIDTDVCDKDDRIVIDEEDVLIVDDNRCVILAENAHRVFRIVGCREPGTREIIPTDTRVANLKDLHLGVSREKDCNSSFRRVTVKIDCLKEIPTRFQKGNKVKLTENLVVYDGLRFKTGTAVEIQRIISEGFYEAKIFERKEKDAPLICVAKDIRVPDVVLTFA